MTNKDINQPQMQGAPGMYVNEVEGKEIYYYVNDNGAIIEIVDVRPNTFVDGFYYETGCTVDIDINVYNDDFSVRVPFSLKDVDTKVSCWDWFDGFWEGVEESVLMWEDDEGNYDGPEKDRELYLALKRCKDEGLDFFDEYDWRAFLSEKDYEDHCWELITNTDYTHDEMAQLDVIKKDIPKIEKPEDIFMAVTVEGTFQIYDAAVPIGDDILFGDTLFEGHYLIKGIKKGSYKDMMQRTVDILCGWATKNGFDSHTHVYIDTDDFEYWEKEYLYSSLQEPFIEIEKE